jgi:hypothetical protein
MAARLGTLRIALLLPLAISTLLHAQATPSPQPSTPPSSTAAPPPATTQPPRPPAPPARPLPDIASLMTQVEAQEKASEKAIHKYIYHSVLTRQETDSHGQIKKTMGGNRGNRGT